MKRVRCPKCDNYIVFDPTTYTAGQRLVFDCPYCGKQFGIKLGAAKLTNGLQDAHTEAGGGGAGSILVIENVFHYKQVFPLKMGDNTIGRYMKNSGVDCAIETADPSMDITHCVINVSRDRRGRLKYTLRDGPSNTGTFVDNELLGDKERRVIGDGALFTLGATSILLRTKDSDNT